ncbi:MAG TPA: outer membrane protein assembly factor BamC [Gammaproteobacteria bacterium]
MRYGWFCVVVLLAGCAMIPDIDDVLPDKRVEYKKSESLPDLEVPPDLTAGAINESMAIPNEQQQASLAQYRQEQKAVAAPAPSQTPAPVDQQWVAIRASRFDIWPRLRTYFEGKGFGLELDDAELGVLETGWSAPMDLGGVLHRYKFKVFSEPGAEPDVTVLFVSALAQEQAPGGDAWLDRDQNEALGKQIAGELNLQFNGAGAALAQSPSAAMPGAAGPVPAGPRAEMMNDEEGRVYLSIPEEFTGAWRHTEAALEQGGFIIDERDSAKGFYRITYFDASAAPEEKGWLSKLAFWKDDANAKGTVYGISLTGMGEKTELIVLNEDGDWETNQDAGRILTIIQNQYNTR